MLFSVSATSCPPPACRSLFTRPHVLVMGSASPHSPGLCMAIMLINIQQVTSFGVMLGWGSWGIGGGIIQINISPGVCGRLGSWCIGGRRRVCDVEAPAFLFLCHSIFTADSSNTKALTFTCGIGFFYIHPASIICGYVWNTLPYALLPHTVIARPSKPSPL